MVFHVYGFLLECCARSLVAMYLSFRVAYCLHHQGYDEGISYVLINIGCNDKYFEHPTAYCFNIRSMYYELITAQSFEQSE
jgi:hypothetical protein